MINRKYVLLILSTLLMTYILSGCSGSPDSDRQDEKVIVLFRYDDYSQKSNGTVEEFVMESFERAGFPFTMGVIPFEVQHSQIDPSPQELLPLQGEKAAILREAQELGIVETALHGYSHQVFESGFFSEFGGLDPEIQKDRIIKGKIHLENIIEREIVTFIPPFNSYDGNTGAILDDKNFQILSASRDGKSLNDTSLSLIPATATLSTAGRAILSARERIKHKPVVVILFHEYDFIETGDDRAYATLDDFSDLLDWISKLENTAVYSMEQLSSQSGEDFSHENFRKDGKRYAIYRILPRFLGSDAQYIYERRQSKLLLPIIWAALYYSLVSIPFLILAYLISGIIIKLNDNLSIFLTATAFIATAALAYLILKDWKVSIRGMSLIAAALGASSGTLLLHLKRKKAKDKL